MFSNTARPPVSERPKWMTAEQNAARLLDKAHARTHALSQPWTRQQHVITGVEMINLVGTLFAVYCFVTESPVIGAAIIVIGATELLDGVVKSIIYAKDKKPCEVVKSMFPPIAIDFACVVAEYKPEIVAWLETHDSSLPHPHLDTALGVVVPFGIALLFRSYLTGSETLALRHERSALQDERKKIQRTEGEEESEGGRTYSEDSLGSGGVLAVAGDTATLSEMDGMITVLTGQIRRKVPLVIALSGMSLFVLTGLIPFSEDATILTVQNWIAKIGGWSAMAGMAGNGIIKTMDWIQASPTASSCWDCCKKEDNTRATERTKLLSAPE